MSLPSVTARCESTASRTECQALPPAYAAKAAFQQQQCCTYVLPCSVDPSLGYPPPLACRERAAKDAFYEQQCSTGSGFLGMATTTLQLLNQLSADAAIKQSFLQEPLVHQAAYASIHFLELLVSPSALPFPQVWSCWPALPLSVFSFWRCWPACCSTCHEHF